MSGEKQFSCNRAMVYGIYAASLLLPAAYSIAKSIHTDAANTTIAATDITPHISIITTPLVTEAMPIWPKHLLLIYLTGAIFASLRLIACIARICYITKRGENVTLDNGYTLVLTTDRIFSPFSFMRYIVISREDYEKSKDEILTHETAHLRCHHWIDQITANIIAIFMWYNPAAWLMIEELKSIHEYQADEAVIKSGTDIRKYQYLLIEKAVGKRFPSPANSLNHSKLKKRVTMMYKSKPTKMRRLAGIAVIPAAIAAIAITDIPAVARVISETENANLMGVSADKDTNNSQNSQIQDFFQSVGANYTPGDSVIKADSIIVTGYGISRHLEPVEVRAFKNTEITKELNDTLSLTATPCDYYVNGERITFEEAGKIDKNKIKSITVYKPEGLVAQIRIELYDDNEERSTVHIQVDENPKFPGGENELMLWLTTNLRYPKEAYDKDMESMITVRFTVNKDGKVCDPTIVGGENEYLCQEALRIVNAMPDWIPGKIDGKPVDSYCTLPINFSLWTNKQ